jgi:hypothetical protein
VKHITLQNQRSKKGLRVREILKSYSINNTKQSFSDSLGRIVAPAQLLYPVKFFLVSRDWMVVLKGVSSVN